MAEAKKRSVTWLVWLLLVAAFFFAFQYLGSGGPDLFRDFAAFREDLRRGRVESVTVKQNRIEVETTRGEDYYTLGVLDEGLVAELSAARVPILPSQGTGIGTYLLYGVVAALVVVAVLWWLARRSQGGMGDIMALRNTRARLIPDQTKATFADVAGCEEAKLPLGDVIDFLRHPQRWAQSGARLPRGVLLEGPPGCGKTLLARAVAGETSAQFYFVSASEFVEMFVGVGAARVRDTFETARKNAPAVIFIDELDAVGRRRGSGIGSSHDEREQTLNQLLVCLDGFESTEPVVVIAATNRPDILDPALVRPGRFDRRATIHELSLAGRLEALRIHTRNKRVGPDVALEALAGRTEGFTGAQLESLANEAALLAMRRTSGSDGHLPKLSMADFEQALRPAETQARFFNKLDAVLIESTTQLAEPTGRAVVRVIQDGGASVEGDLVWADASFLKIRTDATEIVVPKAQIQRLEALRGTEQAVVAEIVPDLWAGKPTGTA